MSIFINLIRFILSKLKINVTYGMILMIDQFWCMFLNSLIRKTKQFWWSWPLLLFLFKAWKMWWTFILGKLCLFVILKCVTLHVLKRIHFLHLIAWICHSCNQEHWIYFQFCMGCWQVILMALKTMVIYIFNELSIRNDCLKFSVL